MIIKTKKRYKAQQSFEPKKARFLSIAALLYFFSICSFALEAHNGNSLKPKCLEYCEKINSITVFVVDKTDKNMISRGLVFTDKIKSVLKKNNKINVIQVDFVKIDESLITYHQSSSRVVIEINFNKEVHDRNLVEVDMKVISPNEVYVKRLVCSIQNDFSCVDIALNNIAVEVVGDYLFKPIIGSIKY